MAVGGGVVMGAVLGDIHTIESQVFCWLIAAPALVWPIRWRVRNYTEEPDVPAPPSAQAMPADGWCLRDGAWYCDSHHARYCKSCSASSPPANT